MRVDAASLSGLDANFFKPPCEVDGCMGVCAVSTDSGAMVGRKQVDGLKCESRLGVVLGEEAFHVRDRRVEIIGGCGSVRQTYSWR